MKKIGNETESVKPTPQETIELLKKALMRAGRELAATQGVARDEVETFADEAASRWVAEAATAG